MAVDLWVEVNELILKMASQDQSQAWTLYKYEQINSFSLCIVSLNFFKKSKCKYTE